MKKHQPFPEIHPKIPQTQKVPQNQEETKKNVLFFPTCQVRVVRLYVWWPSSVLFLLLPSSFFVLVFQMSPDVTSRVQWSRTDFNRQPQINRGALERSGQRRASTRGLWSGLGSAGPQPGGSRADWAAPDFNRGATERIGQRRTSAARRYVRRNVKRYVRKECQKICQKKCQKICQKRMSEDMSEEMSRELSEDMSKDMSEKNVR